MHTSYCVCFVFEIRFREQREQAATASARNFDLLYFRYTGLFNIGKENDLEKYDGVMMMPTLLRPKSRGTIRLASKNPKDLPLIDPRYRSVELRFGSSLSLLHFETNIHTIDITPETILYF